MADWDSDKVDEFVVACRRAADFGLLKYSSGNMSCRIGDGLAAVSASRAWLGELTTDQVAICAIDDGSCLNHVKPTVESGFHLGILRDRVDVNVVLHFQSPFATAISCGRRIENNFNVIPEIPYYIGQIGVVEYLVPGTSELAEAVVSTMQTYDLTILRNHGQVVVGSDYNDAIQKAGFFELACEVLCRQTQPKFITMPKKAAQ